MMVGYKHEHVREDGSTGSGLLGPKAYSPVSDGL
jgi:hypothetical protein